MKGYQLKITIKGSKPPIWRRMVVPEQITFYQLHQAIQEAFGWWDYHLHEFEFKKLGLLITSQADDDVYQQYDGDVQEEDMPVDGLIKENPRFVYTYDFGDTWEHQVLFEKEVEYGYRYPQVIKYKGDNIPEDCGGIGGYYDLLEQLADPGAEEHQTMTDWAQQQGMGEYDLEAVNSGMKEKLVFEPGNNDSSRAGAGACGDRSPKLVPQGDNRCQDNLDQVEDNAISTLEELYSRFDKSELLRIAKVHHMKGCDDLGKGRLIPVLAKALLEPEHMSRFFCSLSDEGVSEFEKAAARKGLEYRGKMTALDPLFFGGYSSFTSRGMAVVAMDVARAYDGINTEEFQSKRRRSYMVWACCKAAVYFYGTADAGQVEAVCRAVGVDADAEEIVRLYKEMKDIWTGFAYLDGLFFDWELLGGNAYKDMFRYQQGKERYIPTPAQVKEIAVTGITEPKKHVRPLKAFLLSMVGCDEETAEAAAATIHHHIRLGCTPKGVEDIMEEFDLTLDSQEKMDGFDGIMEQVWKDTRTAGNCGFSRVEMDAKTFRVAPDSPCPCGSGKRYRQCCGRKQG